MDEYSDYYSTQVKNREIFDKNFALEISVFKELLSSLRGTWARVGTTPGVSGKAHVGLLPFSNILTRHLIFGFEHLSCYQSFMAWLAFRPGLEALLMIGKLVDNPANATIWREREVDFKAYQNAFSGKALESKALDRSSELRQVLGRLNSEFMHPNPAFAYRDATAKTEAQGVLLQIEFFDVRPQIHEAHLLSYLNLLDIVVSVSESLVSNLCGQSGGADSPARQVYERRARNRAVQLARDTVARKILQELGLWKF